MPKVEDASGVDVKGRPASVNRRGCPPTLGAKPFRPPREIYWKHSGSKVVASDKGDAKMLVLMNLIWRRLAYTMLIGMRSKLVRQ